MLHGTDSTRERDRQIYRCEINTMNRTLVMQMVGQRETLIRAAIEVLADNAPHWQEYPQYPGSFQFQVSMQRITDGKR